jgi:hypothetical protein
MREPTRDEHQEIRAHEERAVGALRTGDRPFGYLRIQTTDGARDLLIGPRSVSLGGYAVLDWRRAPLASVFFSHGSGEHFELERGGRRIAGEVEARALYDFCGASLRAIDRPDKRYRLRPDGAWCVQARPEPVLARGPKRRRLSGGEVELDPGQREVVELPPERAVLVLGEAGFGKTTAALHRLAELSRERPGHRSLVIVPTPGLARMSREVLDRLEVEGARVATFEAWIMEEARRVFARLPERSSQDPSAAVMRLKRHPALRPLLSRIAKLRARRPRHDLLRLFGDRALMQEVVERAEGALPRHAVAEILEHTHIQFSATSEEEHAHVVDRDRLVTLDRLRIDHGTPLEDADTIDLEDCAVLFAIDRLRKPGALGRIARYDALVIDEAQERAPIELEALGRALKPKGSLIVSGDEHQQTDDAAYFPGWESCMGELGRADHDRVVLEVSHRCPPEVTRFARAILRGTPKAGSKRLSVIEVPTRCHLEVRLIDEIRAHRSLAPRAIIAVVCRDPSSARDHHATLIRAVPARLSLDGVFGPSAGVIVTTAHAVKGLDLDVVIVPDADGARYLDTPESRRTLYVAVTRALGRVLLFACEEQGVSPILSAAVNARAQDPRCSASW